MNNALAQAERLWANLLALGGKRLATLGHDRRDRVRGDRIRRLLSQPPDRTETLYSGLDRDDVVSIGSTLKEAGIPFDVSRPTAPLSSVPVGQARSRA